MSKLSRSLWCYYRVISFTPRLYVPPAEQPSTLSIVAKPGGRATHSLHRLPTCAVFPLAHEGMRSPTDIHLICPRRFRTNGQIIRYISSETVSAYELEKRIA